MTALNEHLLHHTYLVGERVTVADVVVACTMVSLYQNVLDPGFRYFYSLKYFYIIRLLNMMVDLLKAVDYVLPLCFKINVIQDILGGLRITL